MGRPKGESFDSTIEEDGNKWVKVGPGKDDYEPATDDSFPDDE